MKSFAKCFFKVNSVQEARAKCFWVHIKIWNLANHRKKKWNEELQTLNFQFFINKSSILICFVLFFHVICKISSFNMWTAKHLGQASCTELTLKKHGRLFVTPPVDELNYCVLHYILYYTHSWTLEADGKRKRRDNCADS